MSQINQFFELSPNSVLDCVENALQLTKPGCRLSGRVVPLNSLENRVLDIELDDSSHVVAKFYRPGRWTEQQIKDEHDFLLSLEKSEIPVVAPIQLKDGHSTIGFFNDNIMFAVFPKVRGRILDELSETQLKVLGRYLARIHSVGQSINQTSRKSLNVQTFGEESFDFLKKSEFFTGNSRYYYERSVEKFLQTIEPFKEELNQGFLLHGDCHLGNVLWDGDRPFFVDFDDAVTAPAVQDIWMVIRGRDDYAWEQRNILVDAYCELLSFNDQEFDLIEPLRGLRMIHYAAWIARRWEDPSFQKAFPIFGSHQYWQEEIEALESVCEAILGGPNEEIGN